MSDRRPIVVIPPARHLVMNLGELLGLGEPALLPHREEQTPAGAELLLTLRFADLRGLQCDGFLGRHAGKHALDRLLNPLRDAGDLYLPRPSLELDRDLLLISLRAGGILLSGQRTCPPLLHQLAMLRNTYICTVTLLLLRKMATQLKLTEAASSQAMCLLAEEFKLDFEQASSILEERLAGRRFVFNRDGREYYPFEDWQSEPTGTLESITPLETEATVASADSSCILIGETSDGSAYAVRGAVSFAMGGTVESYLRLGPIIVYLSPKGAIGLPTPMNAYELRVSLSDHQIAERMIRNSIEGKILPSLIDSPEEMIVVADGSLKHPMGALSNLNTVFGNALSSLVGFSKSSSLVSSSGIASALAQAARPRYGREYKRPGGGAPKCQKPACPRRRSQVQPRSEWTEHPCSNARR